MSFGLVLLSTSWVIELSTTVHWPRPLAHARKPALATFAGPLTGLAEEPQRGFNDLAAER
jgi:hypothetical protein